MGRRSVLSNMSKMVLPTVSWVALLRLLKKAPKNLPALGPAEMAMKALMGCRVAPLTDSLRYTDDYFAHIKGQHRRSGKRSKPAALLPIMGGCSSRPHTDSFRVHHVVNQEALQLMLTFGDADFDQEAFFESEELCYGIIRDGDRLQHIDDIYADDSGQASSSMRTCSSSLSTSASRSLANSACAVLSRSSVDSEGLYSTATSASFSHAPLSAAELLHIGPHVSCDSRPSSSMASSCGASELINYSDEHLDHDLKLEAGEEAELAEAEEEGEHLGGHNAEVDAVDWDFYVKNDVQEEKYPTSTSCAAMYNHIAEYGVHAVTARHGTGDDEPCGYDNGTGLHESYEGDAEDDDDEEGEEEEELEIVAEMHYSEDPLEDFAAAICRIVVKQQLNEAAQLQELYWRFLRLNAPSHHHTITLAFRHALHRLAFFQAHLLHTLL